VSAISYYFGDKAGLYRALFQDPRINPPVTLAHAANLTEVIRGLLTAMTEPLKQSDAAQQCVKLFMREMLEPTGVWQAEIENNIQPAHLALVDGLCRHLAVAPDDDIHRLAFSIAGLGVMLQLSTDVYATICPSVNDTPQAIDAYTNRLVEYALAMVAAEAQRRKTSPCGPTSPTPPQETTP
jgi:TetR/AcrR family transcriptional regulator, regulator of cefoperazone and chloramphenicol sensitivity